MQSISNHSLSISSSSSSSNYSSNHQNRPESSNVEEATAIIFQGTFNSSSSTLLPSPIPKSNQRKTTQPKSPSLDESHEALNLSTFLTDEVEVSFDNLSKILSKTIEDESEDETTENESKFTDNESESEFTDNESTSSSNETFEFLTKSMFEKIINEQNLLQRQLRQLTIDNKKLEKTTTRQETVISDLRERVRYLLDFNDQRSSQLKDEIANLKRIINHTLSNSSFSNALLENEELRNLSEEQENKIKRLERTVEKSDEKIKELISTLIESYKDKIQIIAQTNEIARIQKDLEESIKKNRQLESIIELQNGSVNLPEKLLEETSSSNSSSSNSSSSNAPPMTEEEKIRADPKARFDQSMKFFTLMQQEAQRSNKNSKPPRT